MNHAHVSETCRHSQGNRIINQKKKSERGLTLQSLIRTQRITLAAWLTPADTWRSRPSLLSRINHTWAFLIFTRRHSPLPLTLWVKSFFDINITLSEAAVPWCRFPAEIRGSTLEGRPAFNQHSPRFSLTKNNRVCVC